MIPIRCRVYLSAASSGAARAKKWAERLLGTQVVELEDQWWHDSSSWSQLDDKTSEACCRTFSRRHDDAVARAQIFWLLAPESPSRGADNELGYARSLRRMIGSPILVVSGEKAHASIFYRSIEVTISRLTDEEAFEDVVRLARERTQRFAALGSVT